MVKTVRGIYIAVNGGAPMQAVASADLETGRGIVGDRYYGDSGTFSKKLEGLPDKELTLIESEHIDQFNMDHGLKLEYGAVRRNIVTRGIRLDDIIDREFNIGEIRLRGIRLCEPCACLAGVLGPEVLSNMVHKAGLRAAILKTGRITKGDVITMSQPSP